MVRTAGRQSIEKSGETVTPTQIALALAALFLLNLLLRVFYLRFDFVNGDEGVRALSAAQILHGARLYADVVTDKPPGVSLFYAAVFAAFARSMKAVHLAAIVWNFATSVVVYLIGARVYGRRLGICAALFFVYFSTNYFTQDMMAANTELLMVLPYAAAFACFVSSDVRLSRRDFSSGGAAALIATGGLCGISVLFKQVGALNLVFFAVYEIWVLWQARARGFSRTAHPMEPVRRAIGRLAMVASGFVLILVGFALWLLATGALGAFWRNAILVNASYVESVSFSQAARFALGRGLGYVLFNAPLWALALWAAVGSNQKGIRRSRAPGAEFTPAVGLNRDADRCVALWAAVSSIGVLATGRFFGHYFIPALPALSLLAARGAARLVDLFEDLALRRRAIAATAILLLLFLFGLFRFHHRSVVLAYETLSGRRTRWSAAWGMTKRQEQAETLAAYVRANIPAGGPLYIWGYAHDVYWRTGCRPASRYLTPYYIDGRFPDTEGSPPAAGENLRREAAANLLEDLRRNKPLLILDVDGNFKTLPHRELVAYVERAYREEGSIGVDPAQPFRVFRLRDRAAY